MITAITLTGDRPLAFKLCQKWMAHQTLKPDQWIVVDDGEEELNVKGNIDYIRRKRQQGEPKITLLQNLREAIKYVKGDKIVFIEDDDYYAPGYIFTMSAMLEDTDMVGIGRAKYYHIAGKYYMFDNCEHASLAQTAIRDNILPELEKLLPGDNSIDLRLWKKDLIKLRKYIFIDYRNIFCGIKGLPGRVGIGSGHRFESYYYHEDEERLVLRQWIPNDYNIYLQIAKELKYAS